MRTVKLPGVTIQVSGNGHNFTSPIVGVIDADYESIGVVDCNKLDALFPEFLIGVAHVIQYAFDEGRCTQDEIEVEDDASGPGKILYTIKWVILQNGAPVSAADLHSQIMRAEYPE